MVLGKLIEKSVDGDTAALLAGAHNVGAFDHGLGVGLLCGIGRCIDLELGNFAGGLATGGPEVIDLQKRIHHCGGRNGKIDG